jgi:hypothetical protein
MDAYTNYFREKLRDLLLLGRGDADGDIEVNGCDGLDSNVDVRNSLEGKRLELSGDVLVGCELGVGTWRGVSAISWKTGRKTMYQSREAA